MAKPPTSVSPRSRRYSSLAHAVGENRRLGVFGNGCFFRFGRFIVFLCLLIMALVTPFVVVKARLAVGFSAFRALRNAGFAVVLVTAFAARSAFVTADSVALRTGEVAIAANGLIADFARPSFIAIDGGTTVGTRHTVPIPQMHVGTTGVVGAQRIGDDHEEVEQASVLDCSMYRVMPSTFAENLILYMWVSDAVVGGGRMWVAGNHAKVKRRLDCHVFDSQADLKRAKVDAIQFDGSRCHRDRSHLAIEGDFVEFVVQGHKIGEDVTNGRPCEMVAWRREQPSNLGGGSCYSVNRFAQVAPVSTGSESPTELVREPHLFQESLAPLPVVRWQIYRNRDIVV